MNTPEHLWDLDSAEAFARIVEKELIPADYHCAIGGSVLHRGWSDKDVDLFIYPHKTGCENIAARTSAIKKSGLEFIEQRNHQPYGDDKVVGCYEWNGKRVDVFFVK